MANINGPRYEEVNNTCQIKTFKSIIIDHKNSVIKFNVGQFFTSLANNLKQDCLEHNRVKCHL